MHNLSAIRLLLAALVIFALFAIVSISGAAGRFVRFADRPSAYLALLLVGSLFLATAYLIKRAGRTARSGWVLLIAFLTFGVGVGAASFYQSYTSLPYLIDGLSINVTVHDKEGATGTIEARVKLKVMRDDVDEVEWGGMGATGIIKNFRTVDQPNSDFTSGVVQEAGQWRVRLKFAKPPEVGQQIDFAFTFDIVDSPPEGMIHWGHPVAWPTRNLEMTFIAPKVNPCKTAEAYSEAYSTDRAETSEKAMRAEHAPQLSDGNTRLYWAEAEPQQGRQYVVICRQGS